LGPEGPGTPTLFAPADQKASLAWSSSLKTYTIALTDLASGRVVYTFGAQGNPFAFSIIQNDGSTAKAYLTIQLVNAPARADVGEIYWQTADGISPGVSGRALFGLPLSGALPAGGRRTFITDTDPQSAIVFDFATRKVTGTLTSFDNGGAWNPPGPKEQATLEPADIQPDDSFVAVITVAGAPKKGELRGRLLGASGNALAVYWNAPARDGFDKTFGDLRTVMSYPVCSSCAG
jgi:hypothetical protein